MDDAYVIPPLDVPKLAVNLGDGSGRFPIRRVYCVGRNYADHAREMGHDPDREPPFFFSKPADAVVPTGLTLPFPAMTDDLHHEIELVVAIGVSGENILQARALEHVYGYAVGLDMTRRDLQATAKKLGRPWDLAKGFDRSAPCSPVRPATVIGHPSSGAIGLRVNGSIRQDGDLAQQIWRVEEVIEHLSRFVALAPGDLIMTGTPAGVGPVAPGDVLEGRVAGVGEVSVRYEAR